MKPEGCLPTQARSARRAFLETTLALGAGTLIAPSLDAQGSSPAMRTDVASPLPTMLPELPARVFVDHDGSRLERADRVGRRFTTARAEVAVTGTAAGTAVRVTCPGAPLSRVLLRWEASFADETLFLGDHWERGYGDLQWRFQQPERAMPWYFAAHHAPSGRTFMAGVETQPAALCFWTVDAAGVSLWLDFRNGGSPSLPGDREIAAATIITLAATKESPLAALTRFCRLLSPRPRLAPAPICGNNNWYYAYGRDFDADAMRRDAAFLAHLAAGHANRPFCVIDAGWTPGGVCPGGPWTAGDPKRFPDMPGLASDMKRMGVRPGVWMRPTALTTVSDPRRLRAGPGSAEEKPLDLTRPENLELIRDDVARVCSWGYELIKHDFSTYDVFAKPSGRGPVRDPTHGRRHVGPGVGTHAPDGREHAGISSAAARRLFRERRRLRRPHGPDAVGAGPAVPRPDRPQRHGAVHLRRSPHGPAGARGGVSRGHADRPLRGRSGRLRAARLAPYHGAARVACRSEDSHVRLGRSNGRRPAASLVCPPVGGTFVLALRVDSEPNWDGTPMAAGPLLPDLGSSDAHVGTNGQAG
jgi:hypothetical protein